MNHKMPVLTSEQQEDIAAEFRRLIAESEVAGAGYRTVSKGVVARIASEIGGYVEALYTAPPVPVMQAVKLAKNLKISEKSHQSHVDYAEGYNDRAEMDRNAIRAAGYEVQD